MRGRAFPHDAHRPWLVVAGAIVANGLAWRGGVEAGLPWWLLGFLACVAVVLGLLSFPLSDGGRNAALQGVVVVAAGLLGGAAGGGLVGLSGGVAGLRRPLEPGGISTAGALGVGGVLAGWVATAFTHGVDPVPPLMVIGASLASASVLGSTRLVVDRFVSAGVTRSAHTIAVERVLVASDVLVAGLFGCALVGVWREWGEVALIAVVMPVTAALAVFRVYWWQQRRSKAALAEAWLQAEESARLDALTGVANRRRFEEVLTAETSRAERRDQALSLVLIDLDHFKQVNDTHGHQAGDEVLVEAARRLRRSSRVQDIVARFGGEEFAVVVVDAENELDLAGTGDRFRLAIASEPFALKSGRVSVTASVGAAQMFGAQPDELIAAADAALYEAKRLGRDRTVVLPSPPRV